MNIGGIDRRKIVVVSAAMLLAGCLEQVPGLGPDPRTVIRENEAKGLGAIRKAQREAYGWWRRLRWYQKPTIAMVNGWCFGGGYGPLFACDLAFAADEAQFGLSEINWGILPGGGAAKVATELTSFRNAMYHAMMGENVDGKTAAQWGFVNEDGPSIGGLFRQQYRGGRYSWGYPACPDLEDNATVATLLEAGRLGIEVSEETGWQYQPEQTTSAIICHHPQSKYFVAR